MPRESYRYYKLKKIADEFVKTSGKPSGWSKKARQKGYGVEYSTVKFYRDRGLLVIRIPNKQQRGWFDGLDYIVVEKGVLGQSKYQKKYLTESNKERMRKTRLCYPASDLRLELTYRGERYKPIKREEIE